MKFQSVAKWKEVLYILVIVLIAGVYLFLNQFWTRRFIPKKKNRYENNRTILSNVYRNGI